MALSENEITYLLGLVQKPLEQSKVPYWLGRGLLRHHYLTGSAGDQQSDIDIHIRYDDRLVVKEALTPILQQHSFNMSDHQPYKLTYVNDKRQLIIEFMYLFPEPGNPAFVYHTKRDGKHRLTPVHCFDGAPEFLIIYGNKVPGPSNPVEYLENVYGSSWRAELKD